MHRLLQGDVGSGKTIVALLTLLVAVDNGYQAALMVPTEILAEQHYRSLSLLFKGLNIKMELLSSSTPIVKKEKIASLLKQGKIDMIMAGMSITPYVIPSTSRQTSTTSPLLIISVTPTLASTIGTPFSLARAAPGGSPVHRRRV